MDLSAIHAVYEEEKRGQAPYDPRLMTKLLVAGYCTGVFSSRRIQKRLKEDIPFKVKAGNEPDFRTISDFRKIRIQALGNCLSKSWRWRWSAGRSNWAGCRCPGRIKANTRKHKAMSYGRMKEKQLKEEVKQLLGKARAADEEEDRHYGGQRGDELPEELRRRETRLPRSRKLRKSFSSERGTRRRPETRVLQEAKPEDKDQYNFTEPAQIGRTKAGAIDLNKPRMRRAVEAVLALSASPAGFTASDLARHVQSANGQPETKYGGRSAAYDLKKFRAKGMVGKIAKSRRYQMDAAGLRFAAGSAGAARENNPAITGGQHSPRSPLPAQSNSPRSALREPSCWNVRSFR